MVAPPIELRLARGGQSEAGREPALAEVLRRLRELDGYEVRVLELTAQPLPTPRPRLFFLGSRDPAFKPDQWKEAS